MEPHLVLAILNYYILASDIIFFYTAVEYWIEKLPNDLPLLQRFNKEFFLESLSIILEFNYLYINGILYSSD